MNSTSPFGVKGLEFKGMDCLNPEEFETMSTSAIEIVAGFPSLTSSRNEPPTTASSIVLKTRLFP